jgi:hypothetical protein
MEFSRWLHLSIEKKINDHFDKEATRKFLERCNREKKAPGRFSNFVSIDVIDNDGHYDEDKVVVSWTTMIHDYPSPWASKDLEGSQTLELGDIMNILMRNDK